MTGYGDEPRRPALHIGPGGLPAHQIRPCGPDAPAPESWHALPPSWQNWVQSAPLPDPPRSRPSKAALAKVIGAAVVLAVVVGSALWSNAHSPLSGVGNSSQVAVGDCLSSRPARISRQVVCGTPDAGFAVVGRYPGSSDATQCTASPSDVAVVGSGPSVLCLDYVAAVGECLLAGNRATEVGKVSCASGLPGVYRVTAVLGNSIDPAGCPSGTLETLVHRHSSEVLCLGKR
jgi:hypothetical protein